MISIVIGKNDRALSALLSKAELGAPLDSRLLKYSWPQSINPCRLQSSKKVAVASIFQLRGFFSSCYLD